MSVIDGESHLGGLGIAAAVLSDLMALHCVIRAIPR